MIRDVNINNVIVKPLVNTIGNIDISKVKGGNLIPTLYNCTFLCAKRASGKTSTLAEILLRTSDKKTVFYIFCPTTSVDQSWKTLIDKLESRGNVVNIFSSIMEGKTNLLHEIVADLSNPEDEKIKNDDVSPSTGIRLNFGDETKKKKQEYKPKKTAPRHIFVFDDISDEIRKNPAVISLLKKSRHFLAAVYMSSQYLHDLKPESIKQLDYFLCFRSFSRDKLEVIYKLLDLSIGVDKFLDIYDYCFKDNERYSFLYIDVRNQLFRRNFNKKIIFE